MFKFFKRKNIELNPAEKAILGTWKIDKNDSVSLNAYGDSSMRFKETKELDFISHETDKDQISKLTFRIENGAILTNQPSAPREEKTPYMLRGRELVLEQAGKTVRYLKED